MSMKKKLIIGTVTGVLGNIAYAIITSLNNNADDLSKRFALF